MVALEKLQAAQIRMASHYLKNLQQINQSFISGGENVRYALENFDADSDQLERCLLWLEEHSRSQSKIGQLFNDMVSAGQHIFTQRLTPDRCLILHKQALEIAQSLNDTDALLIHLSAVASAYLRLSDNAQMHHYLLQMYNIAKEFNNQEKLAECLLLLSHPYRDFGQYEKAIASTTKSLNLYRELCDARNVAQCLIRLARVTMFKGDWQRAEGYLEKASNIVKRHNYQDYMMQIFENFYELHYKRGNYDEALIYNQKVLNIASQLRHQEMILKNLLSFGILYTCKREFSTAHNYFQQALDVTYTTGIAVQKSSIIANIGFARYLAGDYDVALQNMQKARRMYRVEQSKVLECLSLTLIVNIFIACNALDKARLGLRQVIELSIELEHKLTEYILIAASKLWIATALTQEKPPAQNEHITQAAQWMGMISMIDNIEQTELDEIEKLHTQLESIVGKERLSRLIEDGKHLKIDDVLSYLYKTLKIELSLE